jgi:hypothetical protein
MPKPGGLLLWLWRIQDVVCALEGPTVCSEHPGTADAAEGFCPTCKAALRPTAEAGFVRSLGPDLSEWAGCWACEHFVRVTTAPQHEYWFPRYRL